MSSFLLIDVGNTRLKWAGTTSRGAIRLLGSVPTKQVTSRWAVALAKKYPECSVVAASVVPAIAAKLQRAFGSRAVLVTSRSSGLSFLYPRPTELGADRLAAAAAATGPAIIVHCGTATAFSVIDERGRFRGGVIAPGLMTQLASLIGSTAQLPEPRLHLSSRAMGRSTRDAIRAGVILNFQGGVREILQRLQKEMKVKARIIVTGGYAPFLKGASLGSVELRPLLVFEGLHIIGQRVFRAV